MAIMGFLAAAVLMAVKDLIREDIFTKAFMTTKITSGCDGLLFFVIFSTCLVLL